MEEADTESQTLLKRFGLDVLKERAELFGGDVEVTLRGVLGIRMRQDIAGNLTSQGTTITEINKTINKIGKENK